MSTLYSISSDTLTGLADAVRELTGTSAPLSPDDMIDGIEGHVCPSPTINPLSVTQNGTYTAPSGVDGYSPVSVSVPGIVPTGSQTVTENGTYDVTALAQMIVSVSGGGGSGLEYEEGTWSPSGNPSRGTVNFQNSHTTPPVIIVLSYTGTGGLSKNTNIGFILVDFKRLFGDGYPYSSSSNRRVAVAGMLYHGTTATSVSGSFAQITYGADDSGDTDINYFRYWATESQFHPYTNSDTRLWGLSYKWIAVWKPTT